jgi:hypothetical protein
MAHALKRLFIDEDLCYGGRQGKLKWERPLGEEKAFIKQKILVVANCMRSHNYCACISIYVYI